MEVTIDKVGRVVIPKPVRDALGLAGMKFHLETTEREAGEQEIVLRPEQRKESFISRRMNCSPATGVPSERMPPGDPTRLVVLWAPRQSYDYASLPGYSDGRVPNVSLKTREK